jgi:hypothetical protein
MTRFARMLCSLIIVAAGVAAIASAHAAEPGDITPTTADARDDLSGDWGGVYQCVQGQTAVVVSLALEKDGAVNGTFTFGNLPGRTNAKDGKYRIVGIFDATAGKLRMQPNGWITQPPGYFPVGFTADLDPAAQRLTGHVDFAGCSRISMDRLGN